MDPFVLVHGAWQGAWCWDGTVAALKARGKEAYAPELAGCGDDEQAAGKIGLQEHAAEIAAYITGHDLMDVTLVGTNYSAALLPMVFDAVPNRIDGVIFLDGLIPLPGESVADVAEIVIPHAGEAWAQAATAAGGHILPPDEKVLAWMLADVPEPARSEAISRMRPQPYRTLVEKARYHAFPSAPPYRAYIRCQKTPFTNTGTRMAERAQAQRYNLATGHAAMLSHPEGLADRLLEIVATWNAGD